MKYLVGLFLVGFYVVAFGCDIPTPNIPTPTLVCEGYSPIFQIYEPLDSVEYVWLDYNQNEIGRSSSSFTYTETLNAGEYTFYVYALSDNDCSDMVGFRQGVVPRPMPPVISPDSACEYNQSTSTKYLLAHVSAGEYVWWATGDNPDGFIYSGVYLNLEARNLELGDNLFLAYSLGESGCLSMPSEVSYFIKEVPSAPEFVFNAECFSPENELLAEANPIDADIYWRYNGALVLEGPSSSVRYSIDDYSNDNIIVEAFSEKEGCRSSIRTDSIPSCKSVNIQSPAISSNVDVFTINGTPILKNTTYSELRLKLKKGMYVLRYVGDEKTTGHIIYIE